MAHWSLDTLYQATVITQTLNPSTLGGSSRQLSEFKASQIYRTLSPSLPPLSLSLSRSLRSLALSPLSCSLTLSLSNKLSSIPH